MLAPLAARQTPEKDRETILRAMKKAGGKVRVAVVNTFGPYVQGPEGERQYAADRRRFDRRIKTLGLGEEIARLYPVGRKPWKSGRKKAQATP